MSVGKCRGALSANIYYYYEGRPLDDPRWSNVIVSTSPAFFPTIIQLNGTQTTCEPHYVTITAPLVNWTERYRHGVEYEVGLFERSFSVYGPIGDFKVETVSDLDGYYGFNQIISLYCRGLFGYGGCTDPGYYELPMPRGGAGNSYLYDTDHMHVGGIRNWNDPVTPPYRFLILDESGYIYDRTEVEKPNIVYIQCVGTCLPGGARIGDCCVDCSDLTGNLEAIRQALRRI